MVDRLPTKSDFVVHGTLDELDAYKEFGGKTKDEVRGLLEGNFLRYQEHFLHMGPVAFCYYIESLTGYVRSYSATRLNEDSLDELRAIESMCESRLSDEDAHQLRACAEKIADCLDWIAQQMERANQYRSTIVRRTAEGFRRLSNT
jgi:hypothetical protein